MVECILSVDLGMLCKCVLLLMRKFAQFMKTGVLRLRNALHLELLNFSCANLAQLVRTEFADEDGDFIVGGRLPCSSVNCRMEASRCALRCEHASSTSCGTPLISKPESIPFEFCCCSIS